MDGWMRMRMMMRMMMMDDDDDDADDDDAADDTDDCIMLGMVMVMFYGIDEVDPNFRRYWCGLTPRT